MSEMTKETLMTKPEAEHHATLPRLRVSSFVIVSSLVLRHSSLPRRTVGSGLAAFVICLTAWTIAQAAEWRLPPETSKFKPGPGAELALGSCLLCHSADYVSTQPRLTRNAWKATVEKMRLKYGAPIATNKVDEITDYLTATYGLEPKSRRGN